MKTVALLACIVLVYAALYPLRASLKKQCGAHWQQESMTYLPGSSTIKHALLGFETTFAHYLWIRTVLYFGGHKMGDNQYPWIIGMLDIITRLCPTFYPAYEFGGLLLPDICNNPEAARILLERGITHLGTKKWNLAFYLGMLYYKRYDDRVMAAQCIARGAFVKGAPQAKLLSLAQSLYSQAGSKQEALQLLAFSYSTSENPEVKAFLAEKIGALQETGLGGTTPSVPPSR